MLTVLSASSTAMGSRVERAGSDASANLHLGGGGGGTTRQAHPSRYPETAGGRETTTYVTFAFQKTGAPNLRISRTPPSAFGASLKRYDGRGLVCGDQSGRTFPSSDLVRGRCQSYEASEVWLIPLASTCPVAWRYLMRHVSLHPSSFALPLWLRPRSSGHRHMPRQNRLRPALRTRRKISRRAMGQEDGASFNLAWPARVFGALISTGRDRLAAR
jgi:hypothetical protein